MILDLSEEVEMFKEELEEANDEIIRLNNENENIRSELARMDNAYKDQVTKIKSLEKELHDTRNAIFIYKGRLQIICSILDEVKAPPADKVDDRLRFYLFNSIKDHKKVMDRNQELELGISNLYNSIYMEKQK